MSEKLNAAITMSKKIKVIAAICFMFLVFMVSLNFYRTALVVMFLCQLKNYYRNNTKTESIIAQMISWKILSLCVCMDLFSHLIFFSFSIFFLNFIHSHDCYAVFITFLCVVHFALSQCLA